MVKQKRQHTSRNLGEEEASFSESEVDAAWQLVQLSAESSGRTATSSSASCNNNYAEEKADQVHQGRSSEENASSSVIVEDEDDFWRKNKRFRRVDDLYRSTKPLVVANAKKMRVR